MSEPKFIEFLSRRGYRYNAKLGGYVKGGSLVVDLGVDEVTFYSLIGGGRIIIDISSTDDLGKIVKSIKTYG